LRKVIWARLGWEYIPLHKLSPDIEFVRENKFDPMTPEREAEIMAMRISQQKAKEEAAKAELSGGRRRLKSIKAPPKPQEGSKVYTTKSKRGAGKGRKRSRKELENE